MKVQLPPKQAQLDAVAVALSRQYSKELQTMAIYVQQTLRSSPLKNLGLQGTRPMRPAMLYVANCIWLVKEPASKLRIRFFNLHPCINNFLQPATVGHILLTSNEEHFRETRIDHKRGAPSP